MPSLKLLLTIFSLLAISSLAAQEPSPVKIRTVVIDAGHGGHDPGCISADRRIKEKDIALSVALKFGSMIKEKYPNIKVIYTRSTDVFIPLNERTEIANKNHANLFISIHVNAIVSKAASGSETFVMGMDKSKSNLAVTMKENSVIALEGDVKSKYEGFDPNNPESYIIFSLLQNAHLEQSLILASLIQDQYSKGPIKVNRGIKQGGLLVLWRTTMPAVLTEIGFISNPSDLQILVPSESQTLIAGNLLKAFDAFKDQYEKGGSNKENYSIAEADTQSLSQNKAETAAVAAVPLTNKKETTEKKETAEKTESSIKTDGNGATGVDTCPREIKRTISASLSNNTYFTIQILAVTKILSKNAPDLKGIKDAQYIKVGNFYKYNVGKYENKESANDGLRSIKAKFPGAFLIKVENGVIVPYK